MSTAGQCATYQVQPVLASLFIITFRTQRNISENNFLYGESNVIQLSELILTTISFRLKERLFQKKKTMLGVRLKKRIILFAVY